jgi:LuxR family maltose regulon positive regulatory protein
MRTRSRTATTNEPAELQAPRIPPDSICRPRLRAALLAGLTRPLTLVCAPAGFGKTTLLATTLAESPWPVAWLFLDRGDGDLPRFLQVLVATIQRVEATACRTTLSLLQHPVLPQPPVIAQALTEDVAHLPHELVLVLDDYHLVDASDVDAVLLALLPHADPRLHLVVASRRLPAWPLARMRTAEAIAEVGDSDLRFTYDEAQAFLTRAARLPVGDDTASAIHARMEGWAAGLRLAAIVLRDGTSNLTTLATLGERTERFVVQYLREEVLAQQPPEVREFLLRTALPDRFCPGLAEALMDWTGPTLHGGRMLAYLEQAGLFLSPVEEEIGWYRYQDLFRDALRQELRLREPRATVDVLHRRASAWLASQRRVSEALRHALEGEDDEGAADLVEAHAPPLLDSGEWQRLDEWLRLLPPAAVERRPALLLIQAWVAFARFHLKVIPALLHHASALLEQNAEGLTSQRVSALTAEIASLWAVVWYLRDDAARAATHAALAWEGLPAAAAYPLGHAGWVLGVSRHRLGHPEALQELLASDRAAELERHPAGTLRLRSSLAVIYYTSGELQRAEHTARLVARFARARGFEHIAAWAHHLLGCIYYAWDDLSAAEEHFTAVVDLRHKANVLALRGSLQGLALTNLALGRSPTTSPSMQYLLALTQGMWNVDDDAACAFDARLALMQGDLELPRHWLQVAEPEATSGRPMAFEEPRLTRARVLVALGTAAELAEASHLLAELLADSLTRRDTPRAIEVLALLALAHQARGATEPALTALERAVNLAAPGGFVRPFVDLGPPLARLLVELAHRGGDHEHVGRLLAAFGTRPEVHPQPVPGRESVPRELIEPLTPREQDVLAQLGGRRTNKEIASRLHISWQTVTKHTVNIYQKLQVRDRRAAAHRARALGLIPPLEAADGHDDAPLCAAPTTEAPPQEAEDLTALRPVGAGDAPP